MKTRILLIALFAFSAQFTFAQKVVYVDTEYILSKMPEYENALKQLKEHTKTWNTEIEKKQAKIIDLKATFKQKELLMPENVKLKEQDVIAQEEKNLIALKRSRFGAKGDLYKKQQVLIKPLQDKIFNAIKKMADRRDYDFVLDKSTGVSILFVKPKFDMSDEVLRILNNTTDN